MEGVDAAYLVEVDARNAVELDHLAVLSAPQVPVCLMKSVGRCYVPQRTRPPLEHVSDSSIKFCSPFVSKFPRRVRSSIAAAADACPKNMEAFSLSVTYQGAILTARL